MLFNLSRTAMCVAILLFLALAIPDVGHAQVPATEIEKPSTLVPDEKAKLTIDRDKNEPVTVAINVESKQIRPALLQSSNESKPDAEKAAPKTQSQMTVETQPVSVQDSTSDSGWHFGFAPYLFAPGISGTVGARGRTLDLDTNFGGVWENLGFGLMGAFEARKGRFVILNDVVWAKLNSTRDTPGPFYSTAKVGVNFLMIDPEVGYRLINSEKGSLDALGGVRIWSVEANLNVNTGLLPGFDVSQRKTWAAPVVGVHGVFNVTPKFFLAGKADIGGAGIGADLTSQLYGAAGYRITKNIALLGGYRWLQADYDDEEGFLFDTQMHGLMFGAKFSW